MMTWGPEWKWRVCLAIPEDHDHRGKLWWLNDEQCFVCGWDMKVVDPQPPPPPFKKEAT